MALSLKSILNDRDVSPRRSMSTGINLNMREAENAHEHQHGILTPNQTAEKSSKFGTLAASSPSPQLQTLYERRRASRSSRSSRAPQHVPELDTPPPTSGPSSDYGRDTPSPPAHEFDFAGFNIFKALLSYPELVHQLSMQLDIESLISLYAISKDFHDMCNSHFTSMALAHAKLRAAESVAVFRFRCYENLCQHDPAKRPNLDREGEIRDVPSFRWVGMVEYRERIVLGIIRFLAAEGHRLPRKTSITMKKIWFTMDIGDSARRVGLFRNAKFWTNEDLALATMFFIKLDMRFTDPMDGDGETGLRKLLMAQRGLTVLYRVLKGEELGNRFDLLRLYVESMWVPPARSQGQETCGVPGHIVGSLRLEGWGRKKKKLVQLHELVMSESIRRELGLEHYYMDFLLWGHINPRTFEDIQPLQLNKDDGLFIDEDPQENWWRVKAPKAKRFGKGDDTKDRKGDGAKDGKVADRGASEGGRKGDGEGDGEANGDGNSDESGEGDGGRDGQGDGQREDMENNQSSNVEGDGDGDGEWEDMEDNDDSDVDGVGHAMKPGASTQPA